MASLLIYFAHPGQRYSRVNRDMADAVRDRDGVTFVDLYAAYPRNDIDIDREQARLVAHDAVLFQFPWPCCTNRGLSAVPLSPDGLIPRPQ